MCVFYGHTLRLINIDSELSLLAESQVVSMEQTGQKSKEKNKKKCMCTFTHRSYFIFFLFQLFLISAEFSRVLEQGTDDQSQ